MLTLLDICEKLKLLDEVTLVELLEIRSEDIVERFIDEIEEMADVLEELLDDTD
jgi:hypothetical protein